MLGQLPMSNRSVFSYCLLFASCAGTALTEPAAPEANAPAGSVAAQIAQEVRSVYKAKRDAVVKIRAHDDAGELHGTGFFIDRDGTLLTSFSVGGTSRDITVHHRNGTQTTARRLIGDCRSGIAILRITEQGEPTPFIALGSSSSLTVATPVVTIAYPLDLPITPNFGIIAGFHIRHLDRYFATTHIRANVPVQRGESGAPLLNLDGEAIGVVTSGIDGGASCFAIPSDAITKVYEDFQRFGDMRPGWLGVKVNHRAFNEGRETDTRITEIIEETPAARAGLRVGDVLLKIGGHRVEKPEDVINACFFLTAGDRVSLTVRRDNETVEIPIDAADRDARKPASKEKEEKRAQRFNTREITEDIILRQPEE